MLTWSALSIDSYQAAPRGNDFYAYKHTGAGMVPRPIEQRAAALVGRPILD